jgi:hypothetical protein
VIFIGGHTPYGFTVGERGVKWVMIRPQRADLATADATDYAEITPGTGAAGRGHLFTPAAIAATPRVVVEGGLRERALLHTPGDPAVAVCEAAPDSHPPSVAGERHQFLCVLSGRLAVGDEVCDEGTVVSIPAGTPYTPSGHGGPATYLRVAAAEA